VLAATSRVFVARAHIAGGAGKGATPFLRHSPSNLLGVRMRANTYFDSRAIANPSKATLMRRSSSCSRFHLSKDLKPDIATTVAATIPNSETTGPAEILQNFVMR
jgi:hypothetical protein